MNLLDFFTEISQMFNLGFFVILLGFHLIYHLVVFQHMDIKKDFIEEADTPVHVRNSIIHFLNTYTIIKSEAETWLPISYLTCFFLRLLFFTEGSLFLDFMALVLTIVSAYVNLYFEVNLDLNDAVDPLAQWIYIVFHCFNFNRFGPLSFWGARLAWSIIVK